MACQEASITASLIDALKAGLWCLQRTLGPEKIYATALNSTHPRRGTPLIWYLGVEVMPKCPSKARSLPVGIRALAPKDSLLSASLYSFLPSLSLIRHPKNPHTEYITFDVVDMLYPYNTIFGRGLLNTFKGALHSGYLCLKVPATFGIITVFSSQKEARNIMALLNYF
jgi:hypothetical protein